MSLYHAIFEYDVEHILYETGVLLKAGATDDLENIWIDVLCKVAEHINAMEGAMFLEVMQELHAVLHQPQVIIKDAFVLSVKLSYLLKRVACHAKDRPSFQKLREKIKPLFPEKAALSKDGVATFSKILPSSDNVEEYQFAQRIIAGLSKIWTEGKYEDSRNCLEYLSRKKVEVGEDMDIVTFLWGVVHAYFKDKIVATTYSVYTWHETKKTRKDRVPLLWSIFYWVQVPVKNVATISWRDDELRVFDKIVEKHKDLWQQLQQDDDETETRGPMSGDAMDVIFTFEPRGVPQEVVHEPYQDQRKNIDLKKSKSDQLASKHVKEKSGMISKANETNYLDPRYWRVHTRKEGA